MTIDNKYELTEDSMTYEGRKLYIIRALRDFGYVKAGDLGGWIESEHNLSHEGECWVYDEGRVSGDSIVCGDSNLCENG
jgi:hypothetical protein